MHCWIASVLPSVVALNLTILDWGPICASSCCYDLLSSDATERSWVISWVRRIKEESELSCRISHRKRETYNWGKQWSCCIKHREMSQSYGKARDTNTMYSCTMPFHPASSAHSRSCHSAGIWVLAAGLRPSKPAMRTWRIGRRSLRCRWTPTESNLLSRGKRGEGLLILCYSKAWSSLWSCVPNW